MPTFKLGINMAGAVSAGAYTAGVLDFLTEALDAWYEAKRQGLPVPMHDVSIEVFSGASAGGICAAISAILLQDDFEHIHDVSKTGTTNRFYETWVNKIDIQPLLGTNDLKDNGPVVSLLDCTILDQIGQYALIRGSRLPEPRPYVAPNLTLFLSLTNLRGVPYSLNGVAPGSIEETTFFYGDRIRFETVYANSTITPSPFANQLDVTSANADYTLLQTAAKATAAFPLFLAPRVLTRRTSDYCAPLWESQASASEDIPPSFPPTFPKDFPETFDTLNVDGGVTNNDPFNYAHDYLCALDPRKPSGQLEKDPCKSDRAVLSIAPFPTTDQYQINYDTKVNASIWKALGSLFSALVSQSRFFGESLAQVMCGTSFSHFIVAPSDYELTQKYKDADPAKVPAALQCASLGAFGGFFERGFRAHDYALGRRNCQKLLLDHFLLPVDNIVIKSGLDQLDPEARANILAKFQHDPPKMHDGTALSYNNLTSIDTQTKWMPIIPLCSANVTEAIAAIPRVQIDDAKLSLIMSLLSKRFREVSAVMLKSVKAPLLRLFLKPGPWFIALLGKNEVKKRIITALGDAYKP